MSRTAVFIITRGGAGEPTRPQRFAIAFEPGQSVLDGLRRIRAEQDPTLQFRHACISANACKECMILLDGAVVYACTARMEAREMHLAPLPNKSLNRDLVTEIAPPDERLEPPLVHK